MEKWLKVCVGVFETSWKSLIILLQISFSISGDRRNVFSNNLHIPEQCILCQRRLTRLNILGRNLQICSSSEKIDLKSLNFKRV